MRCYAPPPLEELTALPRHGWILGRKKGKKGGKGREKKGRGGKKEKEIKGKKRRGPRKGKEKEKGK